MTRLTIASLNTRGGPIRGSQLADRYTAIATTFEASDVDVVSFQEVHTYYHLRHLTRRMPSFAHVSYRPSLAGPAGGLVTLSRRPPAGSEYRRFPIPPTTATAGLPHRTRLLAPLKGALLTHLPNPRITIVNTHLLANYDGDWSPSNRHFPLHQNQLAALARTVEAVPTPALICGDFNIARDTSLYRDFLATTHLVDAYGDTCPPTFHAEYLRPGKSPHCIDFALIKGSSVTVESADLMFADKHCLRSGPTHISDHLGLHIKLLLT